MEKQQGFRNVLVLFGYAEQYVPPRCRNPRTRLCDDGQVVIKIPEVSGEQAPIALRSRGRFLSNDEQYTVEFRWFANRLWTAVNVRSGEPESRTTGQQDYAWPSWQETLDLRRPGANDGHNVSWDFGFSQSGRTHSKAEVLANIEDFASRHLIVDGVAYRPNGEPRYVVMTFGLGRNHGGTSVFVESSRNSNIRDDRYFSLLERETALATGREIATGRGDTDALPMKVTGPEWDILMPEAILFRPSRAANRTRPYPDWDAYRQVGRSTTVAEAMDWFYKADRLNREGGTRERLIADRQADMDRDGWACIASYHDSMLGEGVYARKEDGAIVIYRTALNEREATELRRQTGE